MGKEKNVPVLRFPGFEGEWEEKLAGDIFLSRRGKGRDGLPIYSITLNRGMIPRDSMDRNIGGDAEAILNLFVAKADIVYNMMRMWQGAFGLATVDCMVSGAYVVLQPRARVLSKFFVYYFATESSLYLFTAFSYGLTSDRLRLYFKDFAQIRFAAPTFPEQTKIADFLSAVDEKLQTLKKKKAQLEAYKKGLMQKLFSQELRFKDDNGKAFPDWDEKRLGEVLTFGSGRDYKHLGKGDIPVFGTGGLMTFVDSFLHDGETVCIGRKGTIDAPMYFEGKLWTVDTLFFTHSFVAVIPKFVYFVFQTINWKSHNEASGVPSLSKSTLEKIELEIPSLPEQTKIADFLSSVDAKIQAIQQAIRHTENWKKGLLQQLFI